ncbi:TPR-like protein [Hygrophoropsis aurantiaca]|uniref:TPR-like protein n=1 Tax=Hygrophoropsis aurantiaca TaxID=72124 RepID=A0ACB8A7Y5_9AGAM|nr:TPR-like protein [Hygrophoropsis aurantiaca]
MQSTEGKTEISLTVVGGTGLSPSDDNRPMRFYVVVEVDGKQSRTDERVPSPQSTIEWDACFPLKADKVSQISFRLYECSATSHHLRGDKLIWETRVIAEQLLGCNSKFTYMTLPAKAPYGEGHLIVKVELAADTEVEFPVGERHHGEDLEQEIDWHRALLHLRPLGHPLHSMSLSNLANALSDRFKQFGERADLEKALELHRAALTLRPQGHPRRAVSLNNLASALSIQFEQFGDRANLDEAIELNRTALALNSQGHPNHSMSLSNLAKALSTRFDQSSNRADLDEAIELNHAALALRPPEHPHHSASLNNLACTLSTRFEQFGDRANLDEATELNRAALALNPQGHSLHSMSLNNLADALSTQFEQFGDRANLDEAIELSRAALVLCPPGHPLHSMPLNNLASTLFTRFEQFGDRSDLDEAIELNRAALVLCPQGHPDRSTSLNNLAVTLSARFEQFSHRSDLDEAIELNRAALMLRLPGHPLHPMSLHNLALTLSTRFEQFGDRSDLDEAIELNRTVFVLLPPGHSHHPTSLNNLASALSTRFNQFGDRASLDEAIELSRAALVLCPPGNPLRSMPLNNLASALLTRFKQFGNRSNLDEAIELNRAALVLCPQGHPDRSTSLNNLAATLSTRFEQFSHRSDLDEAIELNRAALMLCLPGHPNHSMSLHNLALALSTQFNQSGDRANLDMALQYHELASTAIICGSWPQFQYSLAWVTVAERFDHVSALNAYRASLGNLDRHAISRSSIVLRHELLKSTPSSLSADSASCALRQHKPDTAVELLEQGRGVIWTQMANLRTPLEHLRGVSALGERLATDLQRISLQLDKSSEGMQQGKGSSSRDAEAQHHRHLAEEWDSVVSQVRQVEGFSRFLLPPLYSDLQQAAAEGPVIVINASKYSCDAIIILLNGSPCHVPLPTITLDDVSELSSTFASVLKGSRNQTQRTQIVSLLRKLWDLVVHPIVCELEKIHVTSGSRIWLCPTSTFTSLPLHAAGPYRKGEQGLSDLYIISYTPTLSALIRTRKNTADSPLSIPMFAVIGQSIPNGGSRESELLSVNVELDLVLGLLPPSVPSSRLSDTQATNHAALNTLHKHSWVHIACHGQQNPAQAFDSCFLMHDKPLSLLDIIHGNISHPEFAFLSACHTAVGDKKTPDEIIHLAAGMQFSGFKSVIGTILEWNAFLAESPTLDICFWTVENGGKTGENPLLYTKK